MRVYFDYNATTPLAPEVIEAVVRATRDLFGNASSVHHFGQQAKAALDDARSAVAALIDGDPSEIVFTSGGTEADNFAIRGAAEALEPTGRRHLVASAIEHEAVLNTLKALARRGWRTTLLPVDHIGHRLARSRCARRIADDTALVSVMHANNEIGTIQPIAELARDRARARRADAHRRRAVGRQDSGRRARARRRSAVAVGAQVQRPEGRRRAVDQARHADAADPHRRQARAQPPRGHRERAGDRRPGRRRAAGRAASWQPKRRASAALRDRLEAGILARGARHRRQRRAPTRACRTRPTSASIASRPRAC